MGNWYERVYRYRNTLAGVPSLAALILGPRAGAGGLAAAWLAGGAIFALGVVLRVWAQEHLHYRLKMRMALTESGPYSVVRNPIYIGNTLMIVGVVVLARCAWFVPVSLLWCAAMFSLTVRHEESFLGPRYGEPYADYLRRVPRWLPSGWPRPAGLINEHLGRSVLAELHCLLMLLPFLIKDLFFR